MINCKKMADDILASVTGHGHLAVISVGHNPASESYIRGKQKDCARVGFGFTHYSFEDGAELQEIIECINRLNNDPEVTGVIVQLPLPSGYDADQICGCIQPEKDVDGFRPDSPFKPCTPEGILHIIRRIVGGLEGLHAVVVGRGKLVGKPLAEMMLAENMTVTVCHSKTRWSDTQLLAMHADVVVLAAGKPEKFYFPYLRDRALVIDCGVNRNEDGKLCGDVAFANTKNLTPVPGGVGLLTRAMLIKHVERR